MTTLDLHPEELLDRAAQGLLTPEEQVRLDAHLARCALCRFERQVTVDFGALPRPDLDVDRLVTHALTARASRSLRPRSRRGALLLAAAVALGAMGSFAAVGQWTGVLPRLVTAFSAPVAAAPPVAVSLPDPPSPPPLVEAPPLPPPPSPESFQGFPVRTLERVAPGREARRQPPPPLAVQEAPARDPGELFALATGARLGGDRPLAVARYRQLLAGFPASLETGQTQVSLGRLLLDDGSPAAALEVLDGYLRGPEGTLREEVLATRAQALSRLGRGQEEVRAWQALIESYPDSVHATRARARLSALSAPLP